MMVKRYGGFFLRNVRWCLGTAILFGLGGCATITPSSTEADWAMIYRAAEAADQKAKASAKPEDLISVAVDGMPLPDLLRFLATKAQVSLVWDQKLDNVSVTLEVFRQPVDAVLSMVARRSGVEITGTGGLYYVGRLQQQDRALLVRRVRRLDGDDIKRAVSVLMSDMGRVETFSDGVCLVADRVEVLQKVDTLLDEVEAAPSTVWLAQLYITEANSRDLRDLGVDTSLDVEVAYLLTRASGVSLDDLTYSTAVRGVLQAAVSRSRGRLAAQPLFLLTDGTEGRLKRIERVPVPKRAVSDQGTVTTTGFEYIDAGLQVSVEIRESGPGEARFSYSVEMSEISGYVEGIPITSVQEVEGETSVVSGGVYLLGRLDRERETKTQGGALFTVGRQSSADSTSWELWATVQQVAGPVLDEGKAGASDVVPVQSPL